MKSTFNSFNTPNSVYNAEKNKKNNVSFKNMGFVTSILSNPAVTRGLQLTQTNEIVDKVGVDLGSMVLPRTFIDATTNFFAGIETFRREISATFTDCFAPGLAALGIGWAIEKMAHKSSGIKTSTMMNNDTLDVLYQAWDNRAADKKGIKDIRKEAAEKAEKYMKAFEVKEPHNIAEALGKKKAQLESIKPLQKEVKTFFGNLMRNTESTLNKNTKIDEDNLNKISAHFSRLFERETPLTRKGLNRRLAVIERKIGRLFDERTNLKVSINGKSIGTSAKALVENAHKISKNLFMYKGLKDAEDVAINTLKDINKVKIAGLAGVAIFGFFTQKINRWLTEKKTGKKGFVGYSDFGKDTKADAKKADKNKTEIRKKDNPKLLMQKALSMAAMAGYALATMVIFSKDKTLSLKRLQFNSWVPNIDHVKIAYASVIMGRMFAADDSCELKQTDFRDFLGFTNWLVLGGVVTKATATALSKKGASVISYVKEAPKNANMFQKGWHWLNNVNLKTHNEIFDEAANIAESKLKQLAQNGQKVTGEVIKKVKDDALKEKAKELRNVNASIIAGLAWSGIALGIVVPYLNKKMGQKEREKQLAAAEANKTKPVEAPKTISGTNSTYQANNVIVQEFLKNISTKTKSS